jgi:CHAD domain-containing protein
MIERCYTITDPDGLETIKASLADRFDDIREEADTTVSKSWIPLTGGLFNKGWLLFKSRHNYAIVNLSTGHHVGSAVVEREKPLTFPWEFPASGFATILTDVLEMRALMSLGEIKKQAVRYDLLNADAKIVARMVMETYGGFGGVETVVQCRLMPVRGYAKAAKKVAACLEQSGGVPVERSPVISLMERNGLSPGAYSSKINIALKPQTPAAEAVRCIMGNLIDVMHANLPGVQQDIDSEFLHDFRVSVRRSRSLLSQMKGVLESDTTADLQRQLKAMGTITGNVRDLDVYLLKKAEYTALVPDVLKNGITGLFQTLQRKRRYAKDRMIKAMAGADFNNALQDLDAFVRSDPLAESNAPEGARPIGDLAKTVIYKRYRRIVKKGSRITDATPDERLHELRIDCKKLRYLLEFFISLFPEDQMKILVKQLKRLQENLGDFNDLSVQQEFLTGYLKTIKPQTTQVVALAAATGGLITGLFIAHQRVRSHFLGVFETFTAPENRHRFKALFS